MYLGHTLRVPHFRVDFLRVYQCAKAVSNVVFLWNLRFEVGIDIIPSIHPSTMDIAAYIMFIIIYSTLLKVIGL